jgi:hypothetical protein
MAAGGASYHTKRGRPFLILKANVVGVSTGSKYLLEVFWVGGVSRRKYRRLLVTHVTQQLQHHLLLALDEDLDGHKQSINYGLL